MIDELLKVFGTAVYTPLSSSEGCTIYYKNTWYEIFYIENYYKAIMHNNIKVTLFASSLAALKTKLDLL